MNGHTQHTTATLAMVVGIGLLQLNADTQGTDSVDPRAAREIAVLSRVLENRLGQFRSTLSPPESDHEVQTLPLGNQDPIRPCSSKHGFRRRAA